LSYRKYFQIKTTENETEYNHTRATGQKRNQKKTFQALKTIYTSHLEYDIHTIKPNTFKTLEHMNIDNKRLANINPRPSKVIFLHYYKEL
jgi:hypothetical protein